MHRQDLGKQRPDVNQGKLDLETAYSPAATNYRVYDYMLQTSISDRMAQKLFKEDDKKTPEQKEIQIKAYNIANNSINSSNKYLGTDESKELQNKLLDEQAKRLGRLSNKNKRWKKK